MVLIFVSALLLVLGATPLMRRLATRLGMVDQPDGRRVHLAPVPRLGGVAIYAGFILALVVFGGEWVVSQAVSILVGATLVSFLGIWDDRWGVRPVLKLLGQAVAATILIVSGVQVAFLPSPILNVAVTLLWILGITNALNLLDNMDGLSGGVGAVAAAFFLLLAAWNGQYLVASLSAALLGVCVGFLVHNFNPATIFMGDAGSMFLGFVLAAVGIKLRFPGRPDTITWMIPVVVLSLPIFDTTLVVVSRLRRGINPLTNPGKDHVSHRLVSLGLSQRQAVVLLYAVCGGLGIVGLLIMHSSLVPAYALGGAVLVAGIVGLVLLERVALGGGCDGPGA
ncbi:MAG TPA: undecaprenyl/decaprenyl-phosphate alpha-N-acetylglucosaminyl 1-phosphate transferase [Chloroflexi bacterium]|nr:undecaprenyl/decaprenyl-phosphate alpha-N-acetylglucosaminyl 1-phosphate transferase [Chloroflexota bacterium]